MNQLVLPAAPQTLEQTTLALVGGIITTFAVIEQATSLLCWSLLNDQRYKQEKWPQNFGKRMAYLRRCFGSTPGPLKQYLRRVVGLRVVKEFLELNNLRSDLAHSVLERVQLTEDGFVADLTRPEVLRGGILKMNQRKYNDGELRDLLYRMQRAARLAKASKRYLERRAILCRS
jgi:hypothetical protein